MKKFILAVVLLSGLALVAAWYGVMRPIPSGPVDPWRLRPGENTRSVANRLVAEGRLPAWSAPVFRLTARLRGLDKHIHFGIFRLHQKMSVWKTIDVLSGPSEAGLKVTIPEGRTCQDIAGILRRAELGDSTAFAQLCASGDSARKIGIRADGMEGYLFPDTYLFNGSESPMDIARAMFRRFRQVLSEAGDTSDSPVWKAHGLHGIATLASIVEREAAVRSEAPRIAGVFWNRLEQGIPLGADPTVRYALGKFTGSLTRDDLAIESAYNTRVYPGLPPGPIASPGKDALRAALHPDLDGDWLYFVAKDDGSREHFFAKDLNQHVKYKNQAAHNRRTSGVMAP